MQLKSNLIILILAVLQNLSVLGQESTKRTYCNPIDLNYKYGELIPEHRSYFKGEQTISRSSADPVLINHQVNGETEGYYLFGTSARGYWKSDDLLTWKHVSPDNWPVSYLYGGRPQKPVEKDMIAPAALSVNDTLFVMPSSHHTAAPIYYSTDPASGHFEVYNKSLTFPKITNPSGLWDPALYFDEELDKWYLYYGSSNVYPIVGCELDQKEQLEIKGPLKHLIYLYPEQHGWERFGWDHRAENRPSYMEGAWMTKYNGKYYLQYGAPETGDNIYGTGTYVGTSPLGPFTYAPNNPIGYKPGGFVNGVGHGNTFCDKYGNYWNTGTCWVGVNWVFERRIVMLPAGFDADGDMHTNSRFADFPHYVPAAKMEGRKDLFTGWMLLSYNKSCKASSQMNDKYSAANVTNEDMRSYWVAASNKKGEALTLDLEANCTIKAIQINYADFKVKPDLFEPLKKSEAYNERVCSQFKLYASKDGKQWKLISDHSKETLNRSNPYIELAKPINGRYVKFENIYVPNENLALSGFRVFGHGSGSVPEVPGSVKAKRDEMDDRNATIIWQEVEGAVGYNILWGVAPDKLYQTYQVWADQPTEKEIRALNKGVDYYFSVEAFNENGVSQACEVVEVLSIDD